MRRRKIMTALRPFHPTDLFKTNLTNLDTLTENYELRFYLEYLAKWPSLFNLVEGQNGEIAAYSTHPFYLIAFPRSALQSKLPRLQLTVGCLYDQ